MSTRERWVVYPLLFLTFGIVMRDKVVPPSHFEANELAAAKLRCSELRVDNAIAGELVAPHVQCVELRADKAIAAGLAVRRVQCGELIVEGPNGRPTVVAGTDTKTKGGSIITLSAAGVPLILLEPTDSGGVIFASDIRRLPGVVPKRPKTPATPPPKEHRSKQPERAPAKAKP